MDLSHINTLFDKGKYQEVLDYLAPLSEEWQESSMTANEWLECIIYKSRAIR